MFCHVLFEPLKRFDGLKSSALLPLFQYIILGSQRDANRMLRRSNTRLFVSGYSSFVFSK